MALSEKETREQICEAGRRLWMKGWVASNDGNISMKLDDEIFITTPTGISKGFMTPDMLVKVDINGNVRDGYMKPSSEVKIHIEAYKRRNDIGGVVPAHPPICTGYAVANIPLNFRTLPEIIISLGRIPLAEYGTPSTSELSDSISELILCHDALLLANHGAMTVGKDVMEAYYNMERVEMFANISFVAQNLGGMKPISEPDVKKLEDLREEFGIKIGGSACMNCGTCTGTESCEMSTEPEHEEIIEEITRKIIKELDNQ